MKTQEIERKEDDDDDEDVDVLVNPSGVREKIEVNYM